MSVLILINLTKTSHGDPMQITFIINTLHESAINKKKLLMTICALMRINKTDKDTILVRQNHRLGKCLYSKVHCILGLETNPTEYQPKP